MDRFDIAEVYALHNAPGLELGRVLTTPGADHGGGGRVHDHDRGARRALARCRTRRPIRSSAAVSVVQAIQTIVSRNHYRARRSCRLGDPDPCGHDRQRDPRAGHDQRHGPHLRPAGAGDGHAPDGKEIVAGQAARFRRRRASRLRGGLPGHDQRCRPAAEFAAEVAAEVVGAGRVDGSAGARDGRRGFSPTCCRRGPVPISSWARGRGRGCTTRASISTTISCRFGASLLAAAGRAGLARRRLRRAPAHAACLRTFHAKIRGGSAPRSACRDSPGVVLAR